MRYYTNHPKNRLCCWRRASLLLQNKDDQTRSFCRRIMGLLLLITFFFSGRSCLPGAQSFVLVVVPWSRRSSCGPQHPNSSNLPSSLSVHPWKKYGSTKTALLVGTSNSGGRRRQPASSRNQNHRRTGDYNPAVAINKKLVELGQKKQWRELLEVAEEEQASFNNVNYATVMSQLGRIRSLDRSDPRFLAFLQALAAIIDERGLPWIQARSAANIVHAIGKMKLRNPSTKRILEWISKPETAARFVKEGEPQEVANTAWACATLGVEAPKLFAEIEIRIEMACPGREASGCSQHSLGMRDPWLQSTKLVGRD